MTMRGQFAGIFPLLLFYLFGLSESVFYFGPCAIVPAEEPCDGTFVKFFLYTRLNKESPQFVEITDGTDNITNSNYRDDLRTKILIHGYNSDSNLSALINLKNEYLKRYDANIWMVDWSSLVPGPCYPTAVYNTMYAGKCVALLIDKLNARKTEGNLDLHVVGFSLGAHVPANAAPFLEPYIIPRVTGLDPALPLFVFGFISNVLDASDAEFVDIVHTNALIEGQVRPIGHIDFYMNGGVLQPGCGSSYPTPGEIACSHQRSVEYFAESVNSKVGFWGWRCTSFFYYLTDKCVAVPPFVLMGEDVDHTLRGTFSVDTNGVSPFAIGKQRRTILTLSALPVNMESFSYQPFSTPFVTLYAKK